MRTTLDIDNDVLEAAKQIALIEKSSAGTVVSQWARAGMTAPIVVPEPRVGYIIKDGTPVLPSRGEVITDEHVKRLEDELD